MNKLYRNSLIFLVVLWVAIGSSPAEMVATTSCPQNTCCCTGSFHPAGMAIHKTYAPVRHDRFAAGIQCGPVARSCGVNISCCGAETSKTMREPALIAFCPNPQKTNPALFAPPIDQPDRFRHIYRRCPLADNKLPSGPLVPIYLQNLSLIC